MFSSKSIALTELDEKIVSTRPNTKAKEPIFFQHKMIKNNINFV